MTIIAHDKFLPFVSVDHRQHIPYSDGASGSRVNEQRVAVLVNKIGSQSPEWVMTMRLLLKYTDCVVSHCVSSCTVTKPKVYYWSGRWIGYLLIVSSNILWISSLVTVESLGDRPWVTFEWFPRSEKILGLWGGKTCLFSCSFCRWDHFRPHVVEW